MTEERYADYDEVCAQVINFLSDQFKNSTYIALNNFAPNDDEHQLILSLAKILCNLSNKDLYMDLPLFQYWKMKKNCGYLYRERKSDAISVPAIIDFLYSELGPKFTFGFGEVYQAYYSGKEIL